MVCIEVVESSNYENLELKKLISQNRDALKSVETSEIDEYLINKFKIK